MHTLTHAQSHGEILQRLALRAVARHEQMRAASSLPKAREGADQRVVSLAHDQRPSGGHGERIRGNAERLTHPGARQRSVEPAKVDAVIDHPRAGPGPSRPAMGPP